MAFLYFIIKLNSNLTNLILNKLYPVGSIYLTTSNTNPSTLLGGTWAAFGASDTYLRLGGNSSGGSNSVTLTTANLPSHDHTFTGKEVTSGGQNQGHTHSISHTHGLNMNSTGAEATGYGLTPNPTFVDRVIVNTTTAHATTASISTTTSGAPNQGHTHKVTASGTVGKTGSGTAVTIAPKYVQVYAWKRTA